MDEDFIDVTEKGSKWIAFLFLLIIVIIAVGGYRLVFTKINFSPKTIYLEFGDHLSTDVLKYLKTKPEISSNLTLDISKVNQNEVGEYPYFITCNNIKKEAKVIVRDTKAPTYVIKETKVEKGNLDFYPGEFLVSCHDASGKCLVNFKKEADFDNINELGKHTVTLVISDIYNNKKEETATLEVVEVGTLIDTRKTDLTYDHSSSAIDFSQDKLYEIQTEALDPSSDDEESKYTEVGLINYQEYLNKNNPGSTLRDTEIIRVYNKSNYIIGYIIKLTTDNGIVYVKAENITVETNENE